IHPMSKSQVYGDFAQKHALDTQDLDALASLKRAHETFFTDDDGQAMPFYAAYSMGDLIMLDGQTHYHLEQYEKALDSFSQIVYLETLAIKIPASSERVRIEIINNATFAMLKQPKRDMEHVVKLWKAGVDGATALLSEQRFGEVQTAYDMMQAVWPGEKKIKDLKEQLKR
ncbi:MAG TPA: hypothetical protein VGT99_12675, partial [Gammaproteobacteria bacterium]|nr:hypothetical protein [Gammaproteobacteria bacterium]